MTPGDRNLKNIPASVHDRLLNIARDTGADFNSLLIRYGTERLVFRISTSPHAERFVLKGAWLFVLWDLERRTTRDVDFLGHGPDSVEEIHRIFEEVISPETPTDDGLVFQKNTLDVAEIRDDQEYGGVRVKVTALLGSARIPTQVDIGFGDPLISEAEHATHLLSRKRSFDGEDLRRQIEATFAARATPLPREIPAGLNEQLADDPERQGQWNAFIRRSSAEDAVRELSEVVSEIRKFLLPPLSAATADSSLEKKWEPGGPWIPKSAAS